MTMMCVRGYPDAQGRDMTQRSMRDRVVIYLANVHSIEGAGGGAA